jgi:hypothetical protein
MRVVSLLALMLFSTPVIAQDAQPAAKAEAEEKKICRRAEPATGSMMGGKRVCHTKAEWAQIDAQNQANTDRALNRRRTGMPGGGR